MQHAYAGGGGGVGAEGGRGFQVDDRLSMEPGIGLDLRRDDDLSLNQESGASPTEPYRHH